MRVLQQRAPAHHPAVGCKSVWPGGHCRRSRSPTDEASLHPPIPPRVTPQTARRAIETWALSGRTHGPAIVGLLDRLERQSPADLRDTLRLIEGSGKVTLASLVHPHNGAIEDDVLKAHVAYVIDHAGPYASRGRVLTVDIHDTVKPTHDPNAHGEHYEGCPAVLQALDEGYDGLDCAGDVHGVAAPDGIFVKASETYRNAHVDVSSITRTRSKAGFLGLFDRFERLVDEKVAAHLAVLDRNRPRLLTSLGDTVQGDPDVFRRLLRLAPERIELLLLHEVEGYPAPADLRRHPKVIVFESYRELGDVLHQRGVINNSQHRRVLMDWRPGLR
jgi:hypothetical protein